MFDFILAVGLVGLIVFVIIARRAHLILNGAQIPDVGWINDRAHRWAFASRKHHEAEKLKRELAAKYGSDDDEFDDDDDRHHYTDDDEDEASDNPPGWLDREDYLNCFSRDGFEECGKWARFEYVDRDGVITKRTIVNWERRGIYIVGYDRARKEERTFRQDSIEGWVSG